jgi:peptidyl-prolyl cis-trans isomerase B (cyclophilin B)
VTYPSGPYPYQAQPPRPRPTNGLAIAALVCGVVFAPLGILFGHLSLSQIKRTGEDGRALAITGLVLGYVISTVTVVALVLGTVFFVAMVRTVQDHYHPGANNPRVTASPGGGLPAFDPPKNLGRNCQYPAAGTAAKPNTPPRTGAVPREPAQVGVTLTTDRGNIGMELDNAKAPCTVNNFASLAQQGYFDGTTCHRLATSPELNLLQCGDPSGTGNGGPGYRFPNEYPTNQYRLSDPGLRTPIVYPRGTVAMANNGPGTNGSQFFLVYGDSQLPPTHTVFGSMDETALATVDKIAAAGVAGGGDDGAPATPVTITSARLD